jgi:alpha-L-rhamnosidase
MKTTLIAALTECLLAGLALAGGTPASLRCEYLENPLAIDVAKPRLSWAMGERAEGGNRIPEAGDRKPETRGQNPKSKIQNLKSSLPRGVRQTAYQVLVASGEKLLAENHGDLWDSGKAESGKSTCIEYAGRALSPATRYWWKVRVWDQTGEPGAYSRPARFDTGLGPKDWTAKFIWDGTDNLNNFAYFRKEFTVSGKPSLAKVYVTAHNDYILYLNGQCLGRGPARCNPYRHGQYLGYDITGLVKTGPNVLAAIGHWQGNWKDSGVNAKPAFLLEARIAYPDGSSLTVGSDSSWKVLAHTAFIETDATYFGSTGGINNRAAVHFDARLEPAGWLTSGFDDSGWAAASPVDRSNFQLFAQSAPRQNEQAELKPVSVTKSNGAWLVDFGMCINGWPKITMRANRPGDVVRVEYYQMSNERMPAGWDQYVCRGGKETWKADCGRHTSFQMLKITGYAGELRAEDVRGMWAYSDADIQGKFRCSNGLLNEIHAMCVRSASQNVQQGMISTDANREQSPWTTDGWHIGNVLLYNHQGTTILDKVVRDYAAEQRPNGDFFACSPAECFGCPEWSMYWPMLLWQQYLFSGDDVLLREMAPRLVRFLNCLKPSQDTKTQLLNPPGWRISEWAGGNMPSEGLNITTTCLYYENLRIASRVFDVLGQADVSNDYHRQADEVKAGVNAHLFNGEFYRVRTDRQEMFPVASAWPLRFDMVPPASKAKVVAAIEKAGTPNLGAYGAETFYAGLFNAGGSDFLISDLARYKSMLAENKTNWERFVFGEDEVNHAWTSFPGAQFLKYIAGIQPTSGGFATFDVRPATGGLTFAEGTVPTIQGPVTTRWEKGAGGRFLLSLTVPPNATATVYVPSKSADDVTESGNPAAKAKGVKFLRMENGAAVYEVDSGCYEFVSKVQCGPS